MSASQAAAPSQRLGRYLVLEQVGAGGMGVVFKAYDPELDRRVAIKVLRPDELGDDARARLAREAQAMARLSHPNVVAIYDVGSSGDQLFVAMEFVEGLTLRQWLEQQRRPVGEVLEHFLAAGRGLAAAHAEKMLHRDFKPDNVLVDAEGNVKVTDFGLARLTGEPAASPETARPNPSTSPLLTTPLTQTGTLMGTPAYMAPEQFLGTPADERAEQFNFCVALWEALYGARPFPSTTFVWLQDSAARGRLEPAKDNAVPAHVRRALERGLAFEPGARFPSLEALLDAICADPWRRRRKLIAAGVAVVAMGGIALTAGTVTKASPCDHAEAEASAAWNDAARATVRGAFSSTGYANAATTFERVEKHVGAYANALGRARRNACEATHLRGEQSGRLLDLRMRCLDRRRGELSALVELFGKAPDRELIDRSVLAAGQLTAPSVCDDAQLLDAVVPPPENPTLRAKVESLRLLLAKAKAEDDSGRFTSALEVMARVAADAEATGYAPLRAEALYRLGLVHDHLGDHTSAEASYRAAAKVAAEGNDDLLAAQIWIELVRVVGSLAGRLDEGRAFATVAETALARARAPAAVRAQLALNLGGFYSFAGEPERAVAANDLALRLSEEAFGPSHPEVAAALNGLGRRYWETARGDEKITKKAEAALERSLSMYVDELGPNHPSLVKPTTNLGTVYAIRGDYARGLKMYQTAHALAVKLLGGEHREALEPAVNIGWALISLGRYREAEVTLEPIVASFQRQGNLPWASQTADNLVELHVRQRQWDKAVRWQREVVKLNPNTSGALIRLAELELERVNLGEAIAVAQQALEVMERQGKKSDPDDLARAHFVLGSARYAAGHDRVGSRLMVEGARPETKPSTLAKIDAWLKEHPSKANAP